MGCPKIVLKGNLLEMMSNWQISIGYEDNQIMTSSLSLLRMLAYRPLSLAVASNSLFQEIQLSLLSLGLISWNLWMLCFG